MKPLGPELFHQTYDHYMPMRILFRGRMTVIRIGEQLILHSPIAIDDETAAALDALGKVEWVFAPNLFHHVHLKSTRARYPDATFLGPRGLEAKSGFRPDVTVSSAADLPKAWSQDLELFALDGMPRVNELVLLHRPTSSLIVTDLVFNIQPDATNWITRMVLRMAGAWGKLAQSRLLASLIKDRQAYWKSIETMFDTGFERLIMAHGIIVEDGAEAVLRQALEARIPRPALAVTAAAQARAPGRS